MLVIPSIDIRNRKCVKLMQGDYSKEEVFSANPMEVARRWEREGAKFIHIVDLDGARIGKVQNFEIISKIAREISIPIQVGGGVRRYEDAKKLFEEGVSRVITGSAAFRYPFLVKKLVVEYGKQAVCVAVDYRKNQIVVDGWKNSLRISPLEYAKNVEKLGAGFMLFTCVDRDGMLSGADVKNIKKLVAGTRTSVIASGGINSVEDLEKVKQAGAYGAVVGRALYEGRIKLKEVVKCLQEG
ncbi:MAG: 1-(5-phosphoribosyl)-5-[(5-phosphoribosylamino)methylideneamino]imidazole-4-carboxamide isomerase [Candidatus Micrarchaeia archaeon]